MTAIYRFSPWVGLGGERKRVTGFPLLFFALLRFGKLAVRSVNIVVVRVTSRLVLPLCNHARNTVDEDILQYILRLVQTRLLLAQRRGFEPPVSFWPTHDFQSCSLSLSDISAKDNNHFTRMPRKLQVFSEVFSWFFRRLSDFFFEGVALSRRNFWKTLYTHIKLVYNII